MIVHPNDQDLPAIKTLWQEAFHDSQEDTDFYFNLRHQHENMLVFKDGDQVLGMLSMLPLVLQSGNTSYDARYVFAVATRKAARGQGISSKLLVQAHQSMKNQGLWASVLVPANAALFDFYLKRGYKNQFYVRELHLTKAEIPENPLGTYADCSLDTYLRVHQESNLHSKLYARWDQHALGFVKDSLKGEGGMLLLSSQHYTAVAACERRGDLIRVVDIALNRMPYLLAAGLISKAFPAKRYLVRLPSENENPEHSRAFGMIHWLKSEPVITGNTAPYLGLAKD